MNLQTKKLIAAGALSISAGGLTSLTQWEGLELQAYYDVARIPTVCYGHTAQVEFNRTYTKGECLILLEGDLRWAERAVRTHVKVPITQGQYDALVSFVYNVGAEAFRRSTLLRKLNAGDYIGASNEFLRWNRAGSRYVQGLMNRRMHEREIFIRGIS